MKQLLTKVALSVITALTGGAAWMIAEPGAQSLFTAAVKPFAPKAEAAIVVAPTPAPVTGLKDSQSANTSLSASMEGLLEIARAAERPDIDLIALTAAKVRISELSAKIAGLEQGDEAALELLNNDINETALKAARAELASLSAQADKISGSIRSDFQAAEKELASLKKQLDADSLASKRSFDETLTAIKSAALIGIGSDAVSVVAAASSAEKSLVALNSLKSAGGSAFSKAKRESFNASLASSRLVGDEIAALAAGKKASVFASRDRKADAKYLQDTAAWAKGRMAELEQHAAKISSADRKSLTASASLAAGINTELQDAVVHVRGAAARLAATKS